MIIHSRPVAITGSVLAFFALSFAGVLRGLAPLTCCKRALIGAVLAYFVCSIAVSIVDAVIAKAVIDDHINRQLSSKTGKAKS